MTSRFLEQTGRRFTGNYDMSNMRTRRSDEPYAGMFGGAPIYEDYSYWTENPEWTPPTDDPNWSGFQTVQYHPETGRATYDLTPTTILSQGRINAANALRNAASLTDPYTGELPATLNDDQAAAYYSALGFQPGQLTLADANAWLARGYNPDDPVSFGRGYWEDTDFSGDQTDLQRAFMATNPGLFGADAAAAPELTQRSPDLLTTMVQAAAHDAGRAGLTLEQAGLAEYLDQSLLNAELPAQQGSVAQIQDAPGQATPGLFPEVPPAKIDTSAGVVPTAGLFGQPSPSSTQAPSVNGIPQNYWDGNDFIMPDVDLTPAPFRQYQKGSLDSTLIPPEQAAEVVAPATSQAPSSLVQDALAQNAVNVFGPPGGPNIPGGLFGNPFQSGDGNVYSGLPSSGDDTWSFLSSFVPLPGAGLLGGAYRAHQAGGREADLYSSVFGDSAGGYLSGATGGISDAFTDNPRAGGVGGYIPGPGERVGNQITGLFGDNPTFVSTTRPGEGGYVQQADFRDPGVAGPARAIGHDSIPVSDNRGRVPEADIGLLDIVESPLFGALAPQVVVDPTIGSIFSGWHLGGSAQGSPFSAPAGLF